MRRRILLVEDELAFAEILAEFLAEEGYSVLHVRDGVSALNLVASPDGRRPDLILCDVMLPELRGDRLAREIRARFPTKSLPIMLMSAGADPHVNLPAVSFIAKPFDSYELMRRISGMLASSHGSGMGSRT